MENLWLRPSIVRNALGVTSVDDEQVQKDSIPLKNTRQGVNFKVESNYTSKQSSFK